MAVVTVSVVYNPCTKGLAAVYSENTPRRSQWTISIYDTLYYLVSSVVYKLKHILRLNKYFFARHHNWPVTRP